MKKQELKAGDIVGIVDGSYAVRMDKYERFVSIGLCCDQFKVIHVDHSYLSSRNTDSIHDIHIQNMTTKAIYLHSSAFVRTQKCKHCGR